MIYYAWYTYFIEIDIILHELLNNLFKNYINILKIIFLKKKTSLSII